MRGYRFALAARLALLVFLSACAARIPPQPEYDEAFFARKPVRSYTIPTPSPGEPAQVIGSPKTVTVIKGDTLLDIARWHGLGYNEITAANPGVDAWIPRAGTQVTVPTSFVLPCCRYEGLVVNVPELRAYYYRPGRAPGTLDVLTYPVAIGRDDFKSPRGRFRVIGKTVDPMWTVPERIRQEHIRDRGDARRAIRGGAPDNPLGHYRLELDRSLYRIHGTSNPWGIGMQVTHGCVQLYPEDIERLFPLVPVGTPVEFTYQPVKVGRHDGKTYVEVHDDIYGSGKGILSATLQELRRQRLPADDASVRRVVRAATGLPEPVGPL